MKVKDFILLFPRGITAGLVKTVRTNPTDKMKEYIEENGLYHITSDEETVDKIIESGMLKKTKSIADSYGIPAAFMFAGIPTVSNYLKNMMVISNENNILLNPEKIIHAVKINPNKQEINKMKIRSLSDDAVLHKGNYIFKDEKIEKKKLVLDLLQDKDGSKKLGLREMTEEEMELGEYHLTPECKETIEKIKEKLGYVKENNIMQSLYNTLNSQAYLQKLESEYYNTRISSKIHNLYNRIVGKIKKEPIKALPQPNRNEQFRKQYDINNFESTMTQEDIEKYNEYQQQNLQENQQQYDNENERYE